MAKHLTTPQRKQMLTNMKLTFDFKSNQEFVDLYEQFESTVLLKMMECMGIQRKYFLEWELKTADLSGTLSEFDKEKLLHGDFTKPGVNEKNKSVRMVTGLLFISV